VEEGLVVICRRAIRSRASDAVPPHANWSPEEDAGAEKGMGRSGGLSDDSRGLWWMEPHAIFLEDESLPGFSGSSNSVDLHRLEHAKLVVVPQPLDVSLWESGRLALPGLVPAFIRHLQMA
jgi:hypothetical protein